MLDVGNYDEREQKKKKQTSIQSSFVNAWLHLDKFDFVTFFVAKISTSHKP